MVNTHVCFVFFLCFFLSTELECWICYDMERTDAGPIIEPCQCKGDVGGVHHECLRRWLLEVIIELFQWKNVLIGHCIL